MYVLSFRLRGLLSGGKFMNFDDFGLVMLFFFNEISAFWKFKGGSARGYVSL